MDTLTVLLQGPAIFITCIIQKAGGSEGAVKNYGVRKIEFKYSCWVPNLMLFILFRFMDESQ